MTRALSIALLLAAASLAAAACTANVTESCVGGPCATDEIPNDGAGGSGGGDGGAACAPNPAEGQFPCDVYAVLHAKCHTCHATDKLVSTGAPFSLLTYEDTQQVFGKGPKLRWQRMSEVIEPGAIPHMPFGMAPQLTAEEKSTLEAWFAECAPPAVGMGCE